MFKCSIISALFISFAKEFRNLRHYVSYLKPEDYKVEVLWVITSCGVSVVYRPFGGPCCLPPTD